MPVPARPVRHLSSRASARVSASPAQPGLLTLCAAVLLAGGLLQPAAVTAAETAANPAWSPVGLHSRDPAASGAEDVRSFGKPLLYPRAARTATPPPAAPACDPATLSAQPDAQRWQTLRQTLSGAAAADCRARLFRADAGATVRLFHHQALAHYARRLAAAKPAGKGADDEAVALALLRAGFYARHRAGLPLVVPDVLWPALQARLMREPDAAGAVPAGDTSVAEKALTTTADLLLIADAARLSPRLTPVLLAILADDTALATPAGRRRLLAAQQLIQSGQLDAQLAPADADAAALIAALDAQLQRRHGHYASDEGLLLGNALALLAGYLDRDALHADLLPRLQARLAALTADGAAPENNISPALAAEKTAITTTAITTTANATASSLSAESPSTEKLSAENPFAEHAQRWRRHADKAWARALDIADQRAPQHCAAIGSCNAFAQIQQRALPIRHVCADTLVIRAQEMNAGQLTEACAKLLPIEAQFHERLHTGGAALPGDRNHALEVVVFDDWSEYDIYATALYKISTNNGGMYLEGKPEQDGNQARFISHEADWLRPQFVIWNLEHEYVHYLDARFNLAGNYDDTLPWPLVWWQEGVAEYFAKGAHNDEALTTQQQRQLPLSQILHTPVTPWDSDRVYKLGYLAARYLIEQQPELFQRWRQLLREKRFADYRQSLSELGTQHDAAFARWWQQLAPGGENRERQSP